MIEPDFTPHERYLISMYRSGAIGQSFMWLVIGGTVGLFLYGLRANDDALLFTAFGIVILWEIYQALGQPRAFRGMNGIFDKYEALIHQLSRTSREDGSKGEG